MRQAANWAKKGHVAAGRRNAAARRILAGSLALLAGATMGCEVDSFMDPSVIGYWEHTPTTVPILERLAAIEGPADENIESSKVRPEDLIPDVDAYRVGPGDTVEVVIQDLFRSEQREQFERDIDPRGYIDLPAIPSVYVNDLTADEARDAIAKMLRDRNVLNNPYVEFTVRARRRLTFNIIGGVERPGLYVVPRPDYRLLEGLAQAGRVPESSQFVYVIRQIPLSDAVTGRRPAPLPSSTDSPVRPMDSGATPDKPRDNIIELIDNLSKPGEKGPDAPRPNPGVMRMQPENGQGQPRREAPIDLDDPSRAPSRPRVTEATPPTLDGPSNWEFINNQWVKVTRRPEGSGPTAPGAPTGGEALVTQRVIQIPMAALLAGNQQYNIIVRPGDIVRVPAPPEGLIYVSGQVERPGPYNLPAVGRMTLLRAINSAGGLGQLAIPERVDLTRMVGPDRQATIRLNLRAIASNTQPDIFLRSDDLINVGTNFFALPLAVIRNGFRMSYGFGFLLDRNFGYDVFGPQQTNTPF